MNEDDVDVMVELVDVVSVGLLVKSKVVVGVTMTVGVM